VAGEDRMSVSLHCDCDVDGAQATRDEHRLDCLIGSIQEVAHALKLLGNANAATSMGAIEALGAVVQEGFGDIARAMKGEY
jgi:hypothetical protein